jgi:hypothetical protein
MGDIVNSLGEEVPLVSLVDHAHVFNPLLRQERIAGMTDPLNPVP